MTIERKKNKRGRPRKMPEWEGVYEPPNLLYSYFGVKKLTKENIGDVVDMYDNSPVPKQQKMNRWIVLEFKKLERIKKPTAKDEGYKKLLISLLKKKRGMYASKKAKGIPYREEAAESIEKYLDKTGKMPIHKDLTMTAAERKEFGRMKYKDQYIYNKYLTHLKVDEDEGFLKELLKRRELTKYMKITKKGIKETSASYEKAQKSKAAQKLITMRQLITIKEKYMRDGHTEKEWNALWQ